jgi:ActR/RegA family two-component response regulator
LPPSTRGAEAGIAAGEGLAAATAARFDLPYKEAKRLWTDAFDEAYIRKLLDAHGGNVSAAARTAGIDRKSIQRILARDRSDDPSDGDS